MKKLLTLLLLATLFVSCSSDDDNEPRKIDITSIAIEPVDKDLYVGDEYQLKAKYSPENAETPNYTWKSSNTDIASVSDKGILTAKAEGDVTISASYGEISNSINLKIFNTLFGYKFGSTIEEINPDIKISDSFGWNRTKNIADVFSFAFTFHNNKLNTIWKYTDSQSYILDEIKSLGSSLKIDFVQKDTIWQIEDDKSLAQITILQPDSIKIKNGSNNILIRNGFIPQYLYSKYNYPFFIVEYSQAK